MTKYSSGILGSRLAIVVTSVIMTMVVMAGGIAVAAVVVPNNSVDSSKIINNTVQSGDIKNNTIQSGDIKNGTIQTIDLADGSVTTNIILDGTVAGLDIADGTVASADIAYAAVEVADLIEYLRPRWAKVDPDDTGSSSVLLNGREVAGLGRYSTGVYWVNFNDAVNLCGWTATLFDNGDGSLAAKAISVEQDISGNTALTIRAFDLAGAPADLNANDGFTVQIDC